MASRSRSKGRPALCAAYALLHPPTSLRHFGTNGGINGNNNNTSSSEANKSVYITNIDSDTSNAPLLIGFMDYFLRHIPSIGFFQPIGFTEHTTSPHSVAPSHADLLHSAFPIKGSPTGSVGVTQQEAVARLAAGQVEDLMEDIYQAYDKYHGAYDVVLMEGATQEMIGSNFMEVNAEVLDFVLRLCCVCVAYCVHCDCKM